MHEFKIVHTCKKIHRNRGAVSSFVGVPAISENNQQAKTGPKPAQMGLDRFGFWMGMGHGPNQVWHESI